MTRPPEESLFPESLLPLPPPQAVSAIAPAMPVAISAAWRLLNFTCDASLVPRARGERTGRSTPGLGCLAVVSMERRSEPAHGLLRTRGRPYTRARSGVHRRHRVVTWADDCHGNHTLRSRPACPPDPLRLRRRASADLPARKRSRLACQKRPSGYR